MAGMVLRWDDIANLYTQLSEAKDTTKISIVGYMSLLEIVI